MSAERVEVEWEPGDPLHSGRGGHGGYLFNFRDDFAGPTPGADAAVWTIDPMKALPSSARPLYGEDELTKFILEYRAWVDAGRPVTMPLRLAPIED